MLSRPVLQFGFQPQLVVEVVAVLDHVGADGLDLAAAAGQFKQAAVAGDEGDLERAGLVVLEWHEVRVAEWPRLEPELCAGHQRAEERRRVSLYKLRCLPHDGGGDTRQPVGVHVLGQCAGDLGLLPLDQRAQGVLTLRDSVTDLAHWGPSWGRDDPPWTRWRRWRRCPGGWRGAA